MNARSWSRLVPLMAALAAGTGVLMRAPERPSAWAAADWTSAALETPDGRTVSLRDHIGKKPVLLAFWATWCPTCNATVPRLNAIETGPLGGKVKLLAIDYLESRRKVDAFVRRQKISYTVLLDADGRFSRRLGVPGVPTYILVDRAGRIAWRGHALPADLQSLIAGSGLPPTVSSPPAP